MKKVLSLPLLIVGIGLIALGAYCYNAARDGQQLVKASLAERHITTPADASIPNATIDGAATAMSMSEWIDGTMDKLTDGRAYQEIPAYLMVDGTETNDLALAARDEFGQPKANPHPPDRLRGVHRPDRPRHEHHRHQGRRHGRAASAR